ncbi:MAG: aldehyde dehydrogenase family protein [Demequina sp.]|uniref:aldehyde dehydrogenase family protein n=1 Tax=Demequina sp. TaxID=2050685 RepID=UPI003A87D7A2
MDIDVVNPADGTVLGSVPLTSAAQVAALTADAERVFRSGVWAGLAPRERAAAMLRLADLMERDADLLARLDSQDAGKPITEAREGDIPGAVESIRWFAEAADKLAGSSPATAPAVLAYTVREPDGVVAAILPWN